MIDQFVTFIYTRDMAASIRFYEDLLGLALVLDQGVCRIYRIAGEAFLGVCHHDSAPLAGVGPPPGTVILTLATHDVDGWFQYLTDYGVVFTQSPQHNLRYNIYHCFLRDPNGYLLEIQQFLDPAWPSVAH